MTPHLKSPKKILWAFDPSLLATPLELTALERFAKLAEVSMVEVEPVLVINRERISVSPLLENEARYGHTTKRRGPFLSTKKGRVPFPKILISDGSSPKKHLECLLAYAKECDAGTIAVATHPGRKWRDLLTGNFADNLMARSDLPVLAIPLGVKGTSPAVFGRILFPTDFSTHSYEAFRALLPMAASTHSTVLLFYKCEYIVEETYNMIHTVPLYRDFLQHDIEGHAALALKWSQVGNEAGVHVRFVVDEEGSFLEDSIMGAAENHNASMIALTDSHHHVSAALSHRAHFPVWIFHPAQEKSHLSAHARKAAKGFFNLRRAA